MKKILAVIMVSILSLFIVFASACAKTKASCTHNWVYDDTIYHGQWTQTKNTTCSNSSSLHMHYRQVWGYEDIYVCSKCNATKTIEYNSYDDWVCSLNDPGKILAIK